MELLVSGAARTRAFLAAVAFLAMAPLAGALEGGVAAKFRQFGIVGTLSHPQDKVGHGFTAVQIAPSWVLTAAHVAPPPGSIYANDYGISGISEVLHFDTPGPSVAPIPGALRDDLVLVHLAKAIDSPSLPLLADAGFLPDDSALPAGFATLVANNPSLNRRRYGVAVLRPLARAPGYCFALAIPTDAPYSVRVVSGDSGSAMFYGRIADADANTALIGITSAHSISSTGMVVGVYTRIDPYRGLLDQAVEASGEHLHWTESER